METLSSRQLSEDRGLAARRAEKREIWFRFDYDYDFDLVGAGTTGYCFLALRRLVSRMAPYIGELKI